MGLAERRAYLEGRLEVRDRFIQAAFPEQGNAEIGLGFGVPGVDLQGLLIM